MVFYAHSLKGKPKEQWQTLFEHLQSTASKAGEFAAYFNSQEWASFLGLLHDLGKYSLAFQKRLEGGKRVDHSLAGALEAMRILQESGLPAFDFMAAHIISGHHTGLANGFSMEDGSTSLKERLRGSEKIPDYSAWVAELTPPAALPLPLLLRRETPANFGFAMFFWARMLFSCLVDADYLDTEAFIEPGRAGLRGGYPELEDLGRKLNVFLSDKATAAKPTPVNERRAEVLAACRKAALQAPGLFSLTVPTGGGKTLSSLAFALEHAKAHALRRVIYVIPYTSIIEQTAEVFRGAFGPESAHAVIEHHSNIIESEEKSPEDADDHEDTRTLAFENWDAPIIVTTAVQFFESLFAAHKSRCRKLHNIAGSVVVLDEAQTLPSPLLRPCLAAIKELTGTYKTSFVFCTATQPEVGLKPWNRNGLEEVREIIADPPALFQALERVKVEFIGALSLESLAERLGKHERALCIVNTRAEARDLCGLLRDGGHEAFHLSTWMCPAHRKTVLKQVKERLRDQFSPPVLLVATSLIEAGVDIDFPVVYRAMAGLDSIAQAAGRNNREGSLPCGRTYVFELPEPATGEQNRRQNACRAVLRAGLPLLSPAATALYFDELYSLAGEEGLDKHAILRRAAEHAHEGLFPFRSIEKDFCFIRDSDVPVVIPYDKQAREALYDLRAGRVSRALYRKLQQWIVGVPQKILGKLLSTGVVAEVGFAGQHYMLINEDIYSGLVIEGEKANGAELGLDFRNPEFRKFESGFW